MSKVSKFFDITFDKDLTHVKVSKDLTRVKVTFHCAVVTPLINVKDVLPFDQNQRRTLSQSKVCQRLDKDGLYHLLTQVKGMGQSQLFVP